MRGLGRVSEKRVNRKNNMVTIAFHIPEALLEGLNQLVDMKMYRSRSEAVRAAVRDLLILELGGWKVMVNERGES